MPHKQITTIIYALFLIFIPLVSAEKVIDGKEIIRRMDLLMRGDMSSGPGFTGYLGMGAGYAPYFFPGKE